MLPGDPRAPGSSKPPSVPGPDQPKAADPSTAHCGQVRADGPSVTGISCLRRQQGSCLLSPTASLPSNLPFSVVVPPLVCQLFLAVPHCCKEVKVPQSSSPSEPPQVPEQPAPCQREKRLAKPLSPGILPASPPLRLETSSLSPSVPSSTHHPELALSGTRNFINPFPSQTRGTSACSLGTVDEGLNHRQQTREKR